MCGLQNDKVNIQKVNREKDCEKFLRYCIIKVIGILIWKCLFYKMILEHTGCSTEAKEKRWLSDVYSEHWTRVQDRSKGSSQILPGDYHYCYAKQRDKCGAQGLLTFKYKHQPPNLSRFHVQNLKSTSMWETFDKTIFTASTFFPLRFKASAVLNHCVIRSLYFL